MDSAELRGKAFLDAFAAIDTQLRRMTRSAPTVPFSQVVSEVARRHHALQEIEGDLREFAELRNAIVHQRGGGYLIADPYLGTVHRIEEMRRALEETPTIGDIFRRSQVVCLASDDSAGQAATSMLDGAYSQIPIYDDGHFRALLTAETITRWVAGRLSAGAALDLSTTIGSVLPSTEYWDNTRFLGLNATVLDALDQFDTFARGGHSLDAILVTAGKRRDRLPLAILTVFDIPEMLASLRVLGLRRAAD